MKLESDKRVVCDVSCSECVQCLKDCISGMHRTEQVLVRGGHG